MRKGLFFVHLAILVSFLSIPSLASERLYPSYSQKYGYQVSEDMVSMKPVATFRVFNQEFTPKKKDYVAAKKIEKIIQNGRRNYIRIKAKKVKGLERGMEVLVKTKAPYASVKMESCYDDKLVWYRIDKKSYMNAIKLSKQREKLIDEIIRECGISSQTTQRDAVLLISDYMRTHYHYDYKQLEDLTYWTQIKGEYYLLYNNVGICEDYAVLYQALMHRIGIRCSMVLDTQMNHRYNSVVIGGVEYYIDACWDENLSYCKYVFMQEPDVSRIFNHHPGTKVW